MSRAALLLIVAVSCAVASSVIKARVRKGLI